MIKNKIGKIIKPGDASPWPHEEVIAKTLALNGCTPGQFLKISKKPSGNPTKLYWIQEE